MLLIISGCLPSTEPTTTPPPISGPTATSTPELKATSTPEPEATSTPEPKATSTPEPKATSTPEPEATSTPEPEATSTPEPTPAYTPEPTPAYTLTGEFIAINYYTVTTIDYHRAIRLDNGEIIRLVNFQVPYNVYYSSSTGLKSAIDFYVMDKDFLFTINNHGYAYKTILEEYSGIVYIGRSDYRIGVNGQTVGVSDPTHSGFPAFEVTECDMIP